MPGAAVGLEMLATVPFEKDGVSGTPHHDLDGGRGVVDETRFEDELRVLGIRHPAPALELGLPHMVGGGVASISGASTTHFWNLR